MATTRLEHELLEILGRHLERAGKKVPVAPQTSLRAAGADSMVVVNFLVDVEDAYDIVFPETLLTDDTFHSVETVASAVQALTAGETQPRDEVVADEPE
jgi:acyl carrier protein